jgi:hypothetical protein
MFYRNEAVRKYRLRIVDEGLRSWTKFFFGRWRLKVNRAAEDAVKSDTNSGAAVRNMTFMDAKTILIWKFGDELFTNNTSTALYGKFNPVIKNSFTKVGADKVCQCYYKYNKHSFVNKVNPDLTDYVTNQALNSFQNGCRWGKNFIRTNLSANFCFIAEKFLPCRI